MPTVRLAISLLTFVTLAIAPLRAHAAYMSRAEFLAKYGDTGPVKRGRPVVAKEQASADATHAAAGEETDGTEEGEVPVGEEAPLDEEVPLEEEAGDIGEEEVAMEEEEVPARPMTPEDRRADRLARGRPLLPTPEHSVPGSLPPPSETVLQRSAGLSPSGPGILVVSAASAGIAYAVKRRRSRHLLRVDPTLL